MKTQTCEECRFGRLLGGAFITPCLEGLYPKRFIVDGHPVHKAKCPDYQPKQPEEV